VKHKYWLRYNKFPAIRRSIQEWYRQLMFVKRNLDRATLDYEVASSPERR
jgi:hypothetical protein